MPGSFGRVKSGGLCTEKPDTLCKYPGDGGELRVGEVPDAFFMSRRAVAVGGADDEWAPFLFPQLSWGRCCRVRFALCGEMHLFKPPLSLLGIHCALE